MKQSQIYTEVEKLVREQKIMEKHYGLELIPTSEPIFTDSQETDVWELIRDGLNTEEIISIIKQW